VALVAQSAEVGEESAGSGAHTQLAVCAPAEGAVLQSQVVPGPAFGARVPQTGPDLGCEKLTGGEDLGQEAILG
jgi:hypothetical protein